MQLVGLCTVNYGVPGVGASGITDHQLRLLGEEIDNFPLAFITPLGTDNNDVHECSSTRVIRRLLRN